jgi:hypothetical protein
MIKKIQFYFCTDNYTSNLKNSLEETIQEAREYLKTKNEYCFFFRKEQWIAFDKLGNLLFEINSKYRELDAELNTNEFLIYFNNKGEDKNVESYENES